MLFLLSACATIRTTELPAPDDDPTFDAMVLYDWLEARIVAGVEKPGDRQSVLARIELHEDDSAAYHFARAAVTGRRIEEQRLLAIHRVKDVEYHARRSRELDPDFRGGAATRVLGTLYVLAPATALEHGDSETGVELLEELAEKHPDVAENGLRLAEAYLALGDRASAEPYLCRWARDFSRLKPAEQILLNQLLREANLKGCPSDA